MKIKTKLKKFNSGTLYINIPKMLVDSLYLSVGDEIEAGISSIKTKIKSYRCKKCQHQFDMENDNPYCPACNCKDLEEIGEILNEDLELLINKVKKLKVNEVANFDKMIENFRNKGSLK